MRVNLDRFNDDAFRAMESVTMHRDDYLQELEDAYRRGFQDGSDAAYEEMEVRNGGTERDALK